MGACRGKTALVTDASDASAAAAATALATAGARVLVHDQQSAAAAERIVNSILDAGGVAKAIAADLSTAQGAQLLARYTRRIVGDRLDILVLNLEGASAETAPSALVQLLLPILNQGSSVIFMYPSAAAAGHIAQHAKQLADALKPRGVRVNALEIIGTRASRHVGSAVTFLASRDSSEITGETIRAHMKSIPSRTSARAGLSESRQ